MMRSDQVRGVVELLLLAPDSFGALQEPPVLPLPHGLAPPE